MTTLGPVESLPVTDANKMWVYFLKRKSNVFTIFQKLKPLVEKESGKSIIALRTDNGGEFCSTEFSSFCDIHGIKRQLTTPHTPQQNSVVERRNRTITEMAQSILEHRHVPKKFWAEPVNTAVYLLNWSPTVAVKGKTPEEAWTDRKPKINHLKVFGSLAYVWILDASRTKLDAKSQKLMLARYSSLHKAYCVIDTTTSCLLYSRDVVFDEERGPFMPVSPILDPVDQPLKAHDLGVRLPLGPPDGRAPAAPIIPMIPVQTPPASPAKSPIFVDASPEFDPDSSDEELDRRASPDANVSPSPLRPKWWVKTLADLRDDELIDGRTARKKRKPIESVNFALMASIHSVFEPQTYSEAKGIPEWEQAMQSEHQSLLKNNTWVLSDLPPRKKPIGYKWVYKIKFKSDGTLDKYKARLVVKGFSQRQGIDYEETFSLIAKMSTIKLVLAMAAQFGWKVHQMDVKSAFLNGDLQEEVYMTQPPGFKVAGKEHQVLRLVKALYGLKQAPRAWYMKIDKYLSDQGFQRSSSNSNLYIKTTDNDIILLVICVDDLIITGSSASLIQGIKQSLCQSFDMTNLGLMHYCLGVEVWQQSTSIFISQSKYARALLDKFRMQDCKPAYTPMEKGLKLSAKSDSPPVDDTTYSQLVGSLIYLFATRPDISFAVSYISRFMTAPKADHWMPAKRVLRYVKGTTDYGILYSQSPNPRLSGFTDSDWVGSVDDKKSTSGYVFSLGSSAVTWTSKKQRAVSLSSTKAEYRGTVKVGCEVVWLRRMLGDMEMSPVGPTTLFVGNEGVIKLARNPVFHERTKHVDVHCHYIRQLVEDGTIHL